MRTPADEPRYLGDLGRWQDWLAGAAEAGFWPAHRGVWMAAAAFAVDADASEAALARAWDLVDRWGQGATRLAACGDAEGAAQLAFSAAELADVLEGVVLPSGRHAPPQPPSRPPPLAVGDWLP
jgi:hypothetical protein